MVLSDENQSHMTTIQDDKAEMTALFLQFGSLSPKGQCYAKLLKIISCPSQWSVWSFSLSVCIELLWMLHFWSLTNYFFYMHAIRRQWCHVQINQVKSHSLILT